jgi:hypothetical protein
VKGRPSLEKRRKELQRQNKKLDKAERRRLRKEQRPEPGSGPPVEELTPGELGLVAQDGDQASEDVAKDNSGRAGDAAAAAEERT